MHDDVVLPDGFSTPGLLEPMEEVPEIKLVSVKQIHPRGTLSATFVVFEIDTGNKLIRAEMENWYPQANNACEPLIVPAVRSGFWLVRQEAFHAAGGFDTQFSPALFEDIDLCLSLRLMGGAVLYLPEPHVIHPTRQTVTPEFINLQMVGNTNFNNFSKKWASEEENGVFKFYPFGM